jgi:phosphatidylglycerophosphatase A
MPHPPFSLARLIYTGLGLGLAPKAPGTFGTLLGIPIFWLCRDFSVASYVAVTVFIFVIGTWAAKRAEADLGQHDAGQVVIDEVAGYMVTMFMAPSLPFNWLWGFVFFRIFDIVKPWPVSWADNKIPGAFGVMFDDVLAGLYALGAMQLAGYFLL